MHERHLVDERLVAHILVADVGCGDVLALVSQDIERVGRVFCRVVEHGHQGRVERLVEDDGLVGPPGHATAVIRHHVAVVRADAQRVGHGAYAVSGPARGEYDAHAIALRAHESLLGQWCYLLLVVCQCPVEIEDDSLVFHFTNTYLLGKIMQS